MPSTEDSLLRMGQGFGRRQKAVSSRGRGTADADMSGHLETLAAEETGAECQRVCALGR